MRDIATATATSTAPPEAFVARWSRHKAVGDGTWRERQWLFMAVVRTTYRATTAPGGDGDGGTRVSATIELGGVLQGVWSRVLADRMRTGLPGHLRREAAAVEAAATAGPRA